MALRAAFLTPMLLPQSGHVARLRTSFSYIPDSPLLALRPHRNHALSRRTLIRATSSPTSTTKSSQATAADGSCNQLRYAPDPNETLPALPAALDMTYDMPPRYDPQSVEQALYAWWESSGLFRPSRPNGLSPFVVCMPPPNVTGVLHMGHAMFATIEDILTRFHRMQGRPSLWLPGTDHAGIATQLVVEKSLASEGISRFDLGREEFVRRVWQWKQEKGGYITQQMRRLGASCDWDRERFTLEPHMSSAVAEAFKRLYDAGLIYRGEYMVNWSPNLRTAVSDLEVEFSEESGKLYFFKYPLADSSEFLPIATTRPETILGDTAVCVNPNDDRFKQFIGRKVRVPILGREIDVIADDYVDMEFGTGALKVTPGHDHNDYEIGKRHQLEIINIMNKDASINKNGGPFEGMDRFEARKALWDAIENEGLAIKVEDYVNRVPRSQRGGEIIEPLVSTQWFIKMESLAKEAVQAVRDGRLSIVPQRFEKVYFNWLEDIRDWCISRQLWWGHRIPVWYVANRNDEFVVAKDEEEAYRMVREKYPGEDVVLSQENDVLDTWFSSGLWPFSTMGWPEGNALDLEEFFPGSVLETGYDILFFWVARMVMLSIWLTGKVPFHTVYLHGLVRDKEGRKMSKSLGNVIDPIDTIEQYGTDALRYTLVTGSTPGQDIPLSNEKVEANRNFANKLWNASRYIAGNLRGLCDEERQTLAQAALNGPENQGVHLPLPERYIIARLHILVNSVSKGLESLSFGDAGRLIQEFLWDEFADWYVEISKTRLYSNDENAKRCARWTLVYVMDTCLRLLHPFMPYVTEAIWHRFPRDRSPEKSLIMGTWPKGGDVDEEVLLRFDKLQSLVRCIRNARAEYQVEAAKKIPLTVRASEDTAKDIDAEKATLFLLTKVDPGQFAVEIVDKQSMSEDEGQESDQALRLIVADGVEAVIPLRSMVDFDKERQRLEKQMTKVQKDLDGLTKRLNAPGFEVKAPAAVVAKTKQSAGELDAQLTSLANRLAEIDKMSNE